MLQVRKRLEETRLYTLYEKRAKNTRRKAQKIDNIERQKELQFHIKKERKNRKMECVGNMIEKDRIYKRTTAKGPCS